MGFHTNVYMILVHGTMNRVNSTFYHSFCIKLLNFAVDDKVWVSLCDSYKLSNFKNNTPVGKLYLFINI